VKYSELLRILTREGWTVVRQTGSHMYLIHPDKSGHIIFPFHGAREMGKGLERKIKKQAGIV
jgi:predicted RNA binding protein YcfA (HicA-like mRNA interferase family)